MPRVPTVNYGYTADTRFQWATSDNDYFDRELDLYRLAQALETHDHARNSDNTPARRGAPIGTNALGSQSITNAMLAPGCVTWDKIQDGTIRDTDIQDGTITDAKLATPKLPLAGGDLTGNIRIKVGGGNSGSVYFGTGATFVGYNPPNLDLRNDGNGNVRLFGSAIWSRGLAANAPIYHFFGDSGNQLIYTENVNLQLASSGNILLNPSGVVNVNNSRVWTDAYHPGAAPPEATVSVPVGGIVMFKTQADITAAGPNWEHDVSCAGRLLVGAGSPGSGPFPGQPAGGFVANSGYGSTWMPMSGITISATGMNAVANDVGPARQLVPTGPSPTTNVSLSSHGHTVSGTVSHDGASVAWIPPSWAALFGRRKF